MSESEKSSWDRERVARILMKVHEEEMPYEQALAQLTSLVGEVRNEAIGWAWTEACSQHDRGMDPRRHPMPELLRRSVEDLNPDREEG